jgi:hypothetical protein
MTHHNQTKELTTWFLTPHVLTSPPPHPSSAVDVALQDTQNPSAISPLPHTKPRDHALTRKSYVANQNNICLASCSNLSSSSASSAVDVALQDTQNPSTTSPLPHTKPRAHALTQKSYVANQNNICPRPPQEDIANGSFSSRPGRYHADSGSHPTFHCHKA